MAKKRTPERMKGAKLVQIDNIPKYTQQPRSPAPRRRTDFSLFFCSSSSSLSNRGSLLGLSCVTITSSGDTKDGGEKVPELPLVDCDKSQNKGSRFFSNIFEDPVIEVESVAQNTLLDHCSDRNVGKAKSNTAGILEIIPKESQITESNGVCISPGNVVWAKTACEMWWPAEIIKDRSILADSGNQGIDGHVLVQFYGNHHNAWVDPARDLSQLEDCFEERSCNPMENFQDALKEALQRKENLSSRRQLFGGPDGSNDSDQQDRSSDQWTSSRSSRADGDLLGRRRGKRERKPKIHFDEVTFPLKSSTKVRRIKIMRYLGLTPPVGSPF